MKTEENKYKTLLASLAKVNHGASEVASAIISKIEDREKDREKMKVRVNKELNSVRGKPKRNLPV